MSEAKLPKTIGACVDRLYRMREERLEVEKKIEALREGERGMEEHILGLLNSQKLEAGKGKLAVATRSPSDVPTVDDWGKFYAFVKKHDAFDLLQKRVAVGAVRDRWNDKVAIPGVTKTTIVKLSLRKA